jgi:hypothetical protein
VAHGYERRFDGVRGSQVLPALSREVVESQQHIAIPVGDIRLLLVFDLIAFDECVERSLGVSLRLGIANFLQRALGVRLLALRQLVSAPPAIDSSGRRLSRAASDRVAPILRHLRVGLAGRCYRPTHTRSVSLRDRASARHGTRRMTLRTI